MIFLGERKLKKLHLKREKMKEKRVISFKARI